MKEGQLEIYWTNQAPAPDAVMELVCCGCKGLCQTRRCSCVGNGLPCTEACTCQDNCVNIIVLARKIVKKMMIVMTILMMMIMMTILKIKMTVKFRIGDAN